MTTTITRRTLTMPERLAAIADAGKRWDVTRRAMQIYLASVGEVNKTYSPEWRQRLADMPDARTDSDYFDRMESVREDAVDEWDGRSGDNCTEGTNRFLATFGLPEVTCEEREGESCDDSDCRTCHPNTTKHVTVTVTVTFTITNGNDEYETESDVRNYLRVEARTGSVDDVDDTPDVEIDEVTVEGEY